MIISISGLDGSGKSTQVELLQRYFNGKGIKCRVRHLIKDSLTYFITHKLIGRVSDKLKDKVEGSIRKKGKSPGFCLMALVKKILFLVEMLYFNIVYGSLKGVKNKVIICDRYYYDAIVQMRFLGIAGKGFLDIYKKLMILPDLSFYMKVDPYTAYERKNEFNIDYFKQKEELYSRVFPARTIIVEQGSLAQVQDTIKGKIDLL